MDMKKLLSMARIVAVVLVGVLMFATPIFADSGETITNHLGQQIPQPYWRISNLIHSEPQDFEGLYSGIPWARPRPWQYPAPEVTENDRILFRPDGYWDIADGTTMPTTEDTKLICPDIRWLHNQFLRFVRGEFGNVQQLQSHVQSQDFGQIVPINQVPEFQNQNRGNYPTNGVLSSIAQRRIRELLNSGIEIPVGWDSEISPELHQWSRETLDEILENWDNDPVTRAHTLNRQGTEARFQNVVIAPFMATNITQGVRGGDIARFATHRMIDGNLVESDMERIEHFFWYELEREILGELLSHTNAERKSGNKNLVQPYPVLWSHYTGKRHRLSQDDLLGWDNIMEWTWGGRTILQTDCHRNWRIWDLDLIMINCQVLLQGHLQMPYGMMHGTKMLLTCDIFIMHLILTGPSPSAIIQSGNLTAVSGAMPRLLLTWAGMV
ncbi:MAG: hypothetical protein FWB91_02285 [Defluviitaleaceae bacterium]|nr:hypothetical protein [Defluviitaleaceae bacterium]